MKNKQFISYKEIEKLSNFMKAKQLGHPHNPIKLSINDKYYLPEIIYQGEAQVLLNRYTILAPELARSNSSLKDIKDGIHICKLHINQVGITVIHDCVMYIWSITNNNFHWDVKYYEYKGGKRIGIIVLDNDTEESAQDKERAWSLYQQKARTI